MSERADTRATRRRQETQRRLTEAAGKLIAERGVAGLRIQELTEAADVALGSFYNHFSTKDELVEAVVAATIEHRAAAIVEAMSALADPAEVVSFACRRVVRIAVEDPGLARLFVNLDHADALFETIVHRSALEAFRAGSEAGRFDLADPEVALVTTVGAALGLMRAILDERCSPEVDSLFAESVLRAAGLPSAEAAEISRRPLL